MGKRAKQKKKPTVCKSSTKLSELQINMKRKLEGAKFRMLNEELYSTKGEQAFASFQSEPELFDVYHRGFREQVDKWPSNPLDLIIKYVRKRPKAIVGDFGCGDARLSESVSNTVHSFDLVSRHPRVLACDIAHVPLSNESLDIAVYCLALMGTNVTDYIRECHRVLKLDGILKVAEVKSRFEIPSIGGIQGFITKLKPLGFDLISKNEHNKMFVMMEFIKKRSTCDKTVQFSLKACQYKRR